MKFAAQTIFLAISLILVVVVFKDHKLLAGAEEGLFFYNPQRSIELYQSPWFETGTGYPVAVFIPRITILVIANILTTLGAEIWAIQGLVFFSLFFLGMLYVYLLTKEFFKSNDTELAAILAGIFYLLNLYSFSQIWGRFLFAQIFTFTLLPVITFYTIKFITNYKLHNLIILNLFGLYCSFAYGSPAQIITIWAPSFIWLLYLLYKFRYNKKSITKYVVGFLIVFISWVIVNLWWIYPYKALVNYTFSGVSNWKVNYDSLMGVSQYFHTDQILLLRQSFLFGEGGKYYAFYSHPLTNLLSVLILFFTIFGLIKSKKEMHWPYLCLLLFIGWFVSKGTNPPFGGAFFSFLFSDISVSQVLRNSYEKFGLVWVLGYSICFGLGIPKLFSKLTGKSKFLVVFSLMFFFSGILVWPFWSGDIFETHKVNVPKTYQQINTIINQDGSDSRILVLPIHKGDSSPLDWGYDGVEPSEYLFSKPVISKRLELSETFNNKYDQLVDSLLQDKDSSSLFNELNIKYIVVRHDFKLERNLVDAQRSEATVSALPNIRHISNQGKLSLFIFEGSQSGYFSTDNPDVQLNYQKISPTKYIVNIKNPSGDFVLIFKETYSGGWEARIGQTVFNHIKVYDYANGWEINKSGNFQIEIIFKVWPKLALLFQHT
ncbi:MAG: alpha-(1-_3)-arabinofuranosyltransferase family protein [Actinobacteria bacterium]|nr:alpha-(1->3)-arabinofuranosyltransferase family protein [Actinomycetota bacterium]